MTTPHIVVKRHDVGLYEWILVYGQEEIDREAGQSSISECLIEGIGVIPESENLVEITYRGIHMGTFSASQVREHPEDIADRITESYATLID